MFNDIPYDSRPFYIDEDPLDENGVGYFEQLHMRYFKRCRRVFRGRNRNVFDMGSYVVKIPKNFYGMGDNEWEGSVSNANEDPEEIQYARTRLIYWEDIPIVFMEYVEPATSTEIVEKIGAEPEWVACVDCGQVGFNKNGRLVVYDYGIH